MDDIPDEVDDVVISKLSTASHSRTQSREQNTTQRARGENVLPASLRIRTPLDMLNPAPDGKEGFFDQPVQDFQRGESQPLILRTESRKQSYESLLS